MSTWVFHKIDTQGWLQGSIRTDMNLAQRGCWSDLIALASNTRMRDGTLRFAEDKPMSREYIANVLNITIEELNSCINVCVSDKNKDDDSHRIEIWEDGTIELKNFGRYQVVTADYLNKQRYKSKAIKKNKDRSDVLGTKIDEATTQMNELQKDIKTAAELIVLKNGDKNG